MKKRCEYCGKKFELSKHIPYQKYCSIFCRYKGHYKKYYKKSNHSKLIHYPIPKEINEDVAKLYGHIISDGHLEKGNWGYRISYFNKEIKLINDFRNCIKRTFKKEGIIREYKKNNFNFTIHSKVINQYFQDFDVKQILNSKNNKIKSAFLQACFDDEGHISKQGIISICQKDEKYIENIKKLLRDLGISSKKYQVHNKKYNREYYHLRLLKRENKKFFETINFYHPLKRLKLKKDLNPRFCGHCKKEIINPNRNQKYCKRCGIQRKKILQKEYNKKYVKEYRKRPYVKEKIKEYSKKYHQEHREEINQYMKKYYKRPKYKKKIKEYQKKKEYKESHRKSNDKWRKNNLEKNKAQLAIRKIKIPNKQLCEICNKNLAINKYLKNYIKPFKIQFICKKCRYKLSKSS